MVKTQITKPGSDLFRTLGFKGGQRRTRRCDSAGAGFSIASCELTSHNPACAPIFHTDNKLILKVSLDEL
jgi:hypothetical protein